MTVACLFLGLSPLVAQQTTGEYRRVFRKERVERVDEGIILHSFKQEIYFVPVTAPSGYLFTTSDGLGWEIATGKFRAPSANDLTATNYGRTREAVQWISYRGRLYRKVRQPCFTPCLCLYRNIKRINLRLPCSNRAGNTCTFINGMPHEGDHYDFAYTLIPFRMQKG